MPRGFPFLRGLGEEPGRRRPGMMTPISLAISETGLSVVPPAGPTVVGRERTTGGKGHRARRSDPQSEMNTRVLETTIRALLAPRRGILAADESHGTIARRFEAFGVEATEENRRRYRQMLFTTPGVSEFISDVILFDETLRQLADDGPRFVEVLGGAPGSPPASTSKGVSGCVR